MLDPLVLMPLIGVTLMSLSSALVGCVALVRRRALIGEALSHAAFPGVVLSCAMTSNLTLLSAFAFALLGLFVIKRLEGHLKVKSDTALCFVLSIFLAFGVLFASILQTKNPMAYKRSLSFLYGQATTMSLPHIIMYSALTACVILFLVVAYRRLEILNFDREFATVLGMRVRFLDGLTFFLIALAVVIGIRSVGVVLMSGMLIAPAVAARGWVNRFSHLFLLSGVFGLVSGLSGTLVSENLPPGPVILLFAAAICTITLLKSAFIRFSRIIAFRMECRLENSLKLVWRYGPSDLGFWVSHRLKNQGYLTCRGGTLTSDGEKRAAFIVRLHRLWELYLTTEFGLSATKVHKSAEQMEHILTPELEKRLTKHLHDPKSDPHKQPIPEVPR